MFCSYCRQFSKDKSAFGSEKGNRVKQDWRARLTTPHLNELMRISLLGPACNEFEPMEAIRLWWQGGKRARRPQIQPHGPRRRQARCEHDLDAGDSSDSEEEQ